MIYKSTLFFLICGGNGLPYQCLSTIGNAKWILLKCKSSQWHPLGLVCSSVRQCTIGRCSNALDQSVCLLAGPVRSTHSSPRSDKMEERSSCGRTMFGLWTLKETSEGENTHWESQRWTCTGKRNPEISFAGSLMRRRGARKRGRQQSAATRSVAY